MAIRKNASLTKVAEVATHRAKKAHREWREVTQTNANIFARERSIAYTAWSDLADIAQHLRRLAGLPPDDCTTHGPLRLPAVATV